MKKIRVLTPFLTFALLATPLYSANALVPFQRLGTRAQTPPHKIGSGPNQLPVNHRQNLTNPSYNGIRYAFNRLTTGHFGPESNFRRPPSTASNGVVYTHANEGSFTTEQGQALDFLRPQHDQETINQNQNNPAWINEQGINFPVNLTGSVTFTVDSTFAGSRVIIITTSNNQFVMAYFSRGLQLRQQFTLPLPGALQRVYFIYGDLGAEPPYALLPPYRPEDETDESDLINGDNDEPVPPLVPDFPDSDEDLSSDDNHEEDDLALELEPENDNNDYTEENSENETEISELPDQDEVDDIPDLDNNYNGNEAPNLDEEGDEDSNFEEEPILEEDEAEGGLPEPEEDLYLGDSNGEDIFDPENDSILEGNNEDDDIEGEEPSLDNNYVEDNSYENYDSGSSEDDGNIGNEIPEIPDYDEENPLPDLEENPEVDNEEYGYNEGEIPNLEENNDDNGNEDETPILNDNENKDTLPGPESDFGLEDNDENEESNLDENTDDESAYKNENNGKQETTPEYENGSSDINGDREEEMPTLPDNDFEFDVEGLMPTLPPIEDDRNEDLNINPDLDGITPELPDYGTVFPDFDGDGLMPTLPPIGDEYEGYPDETDREVPDRPNQPDFNFDVEGMTPTLPPIEDEYEGLPDETDREVPDRPNQPDFNFDVEGMMPTLPPIGDEYEGLPDETDKEVPDRPNQPDFNFDVEGMMPTFPPIEDNGNKNLNTTPDLDGIAPELPDYGTVFPDFDGDGLMPMLPDEYPDGDLETESIAPSPPIPDAPISTDNVPVPDDEDNPILNRNAPLPQTGQGANLAPGIGVAALASAAALAKKRRKK